MRPNSAVWYRSRNGACKKPCLYDKLVLLPLLLFVSCLSSRTTGPSPTIKPEIVIQSGNATLRINGQVNEHLYNGSLFSNPAKEPEYYDAPLIQKGTITKDETRYLSVGETYTFPVLPTEVVTVNITSSDGNDVIVIVHQYGEEKEYTLKGENRMGLFLSFHNR